MSVKNSTMVRFSFELVINCVYDCPMSLYRWWAMISLPVFTRTVFQRAVNTFCWKLNHFVIADVRGAHLEPEINDHGDGLHLKPLLICPMSLYRGFWFQCYVCDFLLLGVRARFNITVKEISEKEMLEIDTRPLEEQRCVNHMQCDCCMWTLSCS